MSRLLRHIGEPFFRQYPFLGWFYSILSANHSAPNRKITSILVLREGPSLKHLLHLSPDPSTSNIFTIQKTYKKLLNIDLIVLVSVERPTDTIVLGC